MISVEKDADGLHPENVGLMALKGRVPRFIPCTPKVRRGPVATSLVLLPNPLRLLRFLSSSIHPASP